MASKAKKKRFFLVRWWNSMVKRLSAAYEDVDWNLTLGIIFILLVVLLIVTVQSVFFPPSTEIQQARTEMMRNAHNNYWDVQNEVMHQAERAFNSLLYVWNALQQKSPEPTDTLPPDPTSESSGETFFPGHLSYSKSPKS